jgi:hypothetical protein
MQCRRRGRRAVARESLRWWPGTHKWGRGHQCRPGHNSGPGNRRLTLNADTCPASGRSFTRNTVGGGGADDPQPCRYQQAGGVPAAVMDGGGGGAAAWLNQPSRGWYVVRGMPASRHTRGGCHCKKSERREIAPLRQGCSPHAVPSCERGGACTSHHHTLPAQWGKGAGSCTAAQRGAAARMLSPES